MRQAAQKNDPHKARQIKAITEDQRRIIYHLFDGHPLNLSLVIDHVAIGNSLPAEMQVSLVEARKYWIDPAVRDADRKQIRQAILTSFIDFEHAWDDLLFLISLAPKGVDAELLAWMRKRGKPTVDEIQNAAELLDKLSGNAPSRLSFVKIRPSGRVFLQDVMYELFEEARPSRSDKYYQELYESIDRYYQTRIDSLPPQVTGPTEGTPVPESPQADTETNFLGQSHLRSLQVEQFAYALINNPVSGLQCFGEITDRAALDHDEDLFLELSDELLRFHDKHRKNRLPAVP